MNRRLRAEWGPPDYADEAILAWDLERLRRDRAAKASQDAGPR